jgi:hypothetical protein
MESEPVRVLGVAANDCAGNTVAFDSLALLAWRMKPQGAVTAWKACGRRLAQGFDFSVLCGSPMESEPARVAGAASKVAGRAKRCGSCPPLSSLDTWKMRRRRGNGP